jgi:hypothetical protein
VKVRAAGHRWHSRCCRCHRCCHMFRSDRHGCGGCYGVALRSCGAGSERGGGDRFEWGSAENMCAPRERECTRQNDDPSEARQRKRAGERRIQRGRWEERGRESPHRRERLRQPDSSRDVDRAPDSVLQSHASLVTVFARDKDVRRCTEKKISDVSFLAMG